MVPILRKLRPQRLSMIGCYNKRPTRGGKTWSLHAWAIALDFDSKGSAQYTHAPQAVLSQPIYAPFWKIWYHHGFFSQGMEVDVYKRAGAGTSPDWMHVQFAYYSGYKP